MKTGKLLLAAGLLMAGLSAHAEEEPLWMRYTAISPDGKTIAFSYKGDVYTVALQAVRLDSLPPMRPMMPVRYGAPMAPNWLSLQVAKVAWMCM